MWTRHKVHISFDIKQTPVHTRIPEFSHLEEWRESSLGSFFAQHFHVVCCTNSVEFPHRSPFHAISSCNKSTRLDARWDGHERTFKKVLLNVTDWECWHRILIKRLMVFVGKIQLNILCLYSTEIDPSDICYFEFLLEIDPSDICYFEFLLIY